MSYAEVVKEAAPRKTEGDKGLKVPVRSITMSWTGTYEVEEWLSRSAVGTLKNFGSVEDVNQKLDDRGFVFSSTFLGGNNIVWTFQSQCERDGFINNRFLWKERFFSMKVWSEQSQVQALKKMSWVEVYGVPLNCWCKDFFHKVGDLMGEVLWIDKDTEFKRRLDVGKVLVLKQLGQVLESEVAVKDGSHVFPVKLVECPTTVSEEWISIQLGLRLAFSNLNCRPDRVGSDKVWSMSRGFSSEEEGRPDLDREGGREAVTVNSRDKKESRKGVREQSMRSPIFVRKEVGGGKVLLEKGKD
ncbi:hypothetical protein Q3G72_023028 [Acer saccharum]|nr:hypothetical protein Q3G72_023028 [Acer saccharum]